MFHAINHTPSCLYITRFKPYHLLMVDTHDRRFTCLSHLFPPIHVFSRFASNSERTQKGHRQFLLLTAVKIPM